MLKKRFFKTKDECEVTFELQSEDHERAELVCDSNGWEPIAMKKTRQGPFKARVRLPKGRDYEFRYRLDGTEWANDEAADAYRPNAFGGRNGVLRTDGP